MFWGGYSLCPLCVFIELTGVQSAVGVRYRVECAEYLQTVVGRLRAGTCAAQGEEGKRLNIKRQRDLARKVGQKTYFAVVPSSATLQRPLRSTCSQRRGGIVRAGWGRPPSSSNRGRGWEGHSKTQFKNLKAVQPEQSLVPKIVGLGPCRGHGEGSRLPEEQLWQAALRQRRGVLWPELRQAQGAIATCSFHPTIAPSPWCLHVCSSRWSLRQHPRDTARAVQPREG